MYTLPFPRFSFHGCRYGSSLTFPYCLLDFACLLLFVCFFQKFCHELRNLQDHQMEKLRIRRNAVSGEPEIQCFMEKLKQYLQVSQRIGKQYSQEILMEVSDFVIISYYFGMFHGWSSYLTSQLLF